MVKFTETCISCKITSKDLDKLFGEDFVYTRELKAICINCAFEEYMGEELKEEE